MNEINLVVEDGDGDGKGGLHGKYGPVVSVKVHACNGFEEGVTHTNFVFREIDRHSGGTSQRGVSNYDAICSVDVATPNFRRSFSFGEEELSPPWMNHD